LKNFRFYFSLAVLAVSCLLPNTIGAEGVVRPSSAGEIVILNEEELIKMDFIDVQALDLDIRVELKYASVDNFMRSAVYGEFKKAWLRKDAAIKLAQANKYLKELRPDLTLLVGDALRPRRISWKMWKELSGSPMQRYVADPRAGSMHNYGCAVDITISDMNGKRLDMGTPLDFFGELAQPRYEERFLTEGQLTEEQVANRRLLRKVMYRAGFHGINNEWWHFEAFDKKHIRKTYSIVE